MDECQFIITEMHEIIEVAESFSEIEAYASRLEMNVF